MIRGGRLFILLLFVLPVIAGGQPLDSLTARFHQELNTRTWRLTESYNTATPWFTLSSSGYGELTQRKLPGYESQWKNDLSAQLNLTRRLNDELTFLVEMQGQEFRDREAEFMSDHRISQVYPQNYDFAADRIQPIIGQDSRIARAMTRAGAKYRPASTFESHLLVGGSFDSQLESNGEGFSGRGGFFWQDALNTQMDLETDGWLNRYDNRSNHHVFSRALTLRQFGDATDQLAASWQHRRSDLFLGAGGQIVSRVSEEIRVDNRLAAPLMPQLTGEYLLSYRQSNVDYLGGGPGAGNEMDFINRLLFTGIWRDWLGRLSYRYGFEDREYGDLILGRNQALGFDAEWDRGPDSVAVRISTEKWRYDSPEELELSDRDRLIHRFSTTAEVEVLEQTAMTVEALVILDHLVNLHEQRSADNRWNRVFRFRPGVIWRPGPIWRNRAVFEVLANYTDYDFEDPESGQPLRSNVFRRWSASDSLRVPLPAMLIGEVAGRVDLEDRGRLRWEEFVQEVSDEKLAYYWGASLSRLFWSHFMLEVGYREQWREDDRLDLGPTGEPVRTRVGTYQVTGPFFRLRTYGFKGLHVKIEAVLQRVEDSSNDRRDRLDQIDAVLVYRW